jgi:hypothetical protein
VEAGDVSGIRNEGDALVYLTDCTLATVCHMALQKRRSKSEFSRQIAIAQRGFDWAAQFGAQMANSRLSDVAINFCGSVHEWAHSHIGKHAE